MANPYDYALNPPTQTPTESTSWVTGLKQDLGPAALINAPFPGAIALAPLAAGLGTRLDTIGGWKNLGEIDRWQGIAADPGDFARNAVTLGGYGRGEDAAAAKRAYEQAVNQWRRQMGDRLVNLSGNVLSRQGALAQAADTRQMAAGLDPKAYKDELAKWQLGVEQAARNEARQRQLAEINQWMLDPSRTQARTAAMDAQRQSALKGVGDIAKAQARENAFQQARRGGLGGSWDVVQRGDITRRSNEAAQGVQANYENLAQQYRLGDENLMKTMTGLVYEDDPARQEVRQMQMNQIAAGMQGLQDQYQTQNQIAQSRLAQSQNMLGAFTSGAGAMLPMMQWSLNSQNRGSGG